MIGIILLEIWYADIKKKREDFEIKLLLLLNQKEKRKNKEKFIRKIHIYLLSNKRDE